MPCKPYKPYMPCKPYKPYMPCKTTGAERGEEVN
jgi:hypothetical protein